ncbi:MAG: serine hydrolase domain-containing protein [Parvularculaceae bacterium]
MRKIAGVLAVMLLTLALWTGAILAGVLEGWWRQPLAPRDAGTEAIMAAAVAKIDRDHKGNAAFVVIEDGDVHDRHFVSIGLPVDDDTLFQVASLSKWITAWGVMTLVEAGKIDLDTPVSKYLTRWRLPDSEFDNNGVTVRRLLSHRAGLSDGLGYAGFGPGEEIQSLEASLEATADASPGADGTVKVGYAPGSEFHYSGGGFTLLQLLVEEVSGESFDGYMTRAVLAPLGMSRSAFVLPEGGVSNLAEFYGEDGKPAVHYRFTATAAASLYTSTADLTRLLQAHVAGRNGEPAGRGVLSPATLKEMRRPHASQFGAAIWGLGTILYADNNSGDFIIGHDGSNAPAINTAARVDPATGDGVIALVTGNQRLATNIAGEWVFWRTGNVDTFMFLAEAKRVFPVLAAGWLAIIVAAIFFGARRRRR